MSNHQIKLNGNAMVTNKKQNGSPFGLPPFLNHHFVWVGVLLLLHYPLSGSVLQSC